MVPKKRKSKTQGIAVPAIIFLSVAGIAIAYAQLDIDWSELRPKPTPQESASVSNTTVDGGHNIHIKAGDNTTVTLTIPAGGMPESTGPGKAGLQHSPGSGDSIDLSTGKDGNNPAGPVEVLDEIPADNANALAIPVMEHEGYSPEPYELEGIKHICYGQITARDKPMTARECVDLLSDSLNWALHLAIDFVGESQWESIGVYRQGVFLELAYMLGQDRLMKFRSLRDATINKKWEAAGHEIQDSHLPRQIGQNRVDSLVNRLVNPGDS